MRLGGSRRTIVSTGGVRRVAFEFQTVTRRLRKPSNLKPLHDSYASPRIPNGPVASAAIGPTRTLAALQRPCRCPRIPRAASVGRTSLPLPPFIRPLAEGGSLPPHEVGSTRDGGDAWRPGGGSSWDASTGGLGLGSLDVTHESGCWRPPGGSGGFVGEVCFDLSIAAPGASRQNRIG